MLDKLLKVKLFSLIENKKGCEIKRIKLRKEEITLAFSKNKLTAANLRPFPLVEPFVNVFV